MPPVLFQARKSTSDMIYPVPEGNPDIDPNFVAPVPPKTQKQTTSQKFIGVHPPPAWSKIVQDVVLPLDIPMSVTYVGSQQS